jgi:hypothetical protein
MRKNIWLLAFLPLVIPTFALGLANTECIQYSQLPTEIGELSDPMDLRHVSHDGDNFCYMTWGDLGESGLRLVWGQAPVGADPVILGEFSSTLLFPTAIDCEGSIVCVAYQDLGVAFSYGWLIVDFSVPASPVQRGQFASTREIVDVEMAGSVVCLAVELEAFRVFDVSDLDAPVEVASLPNIAWTGSVTEDAGTWYIGGAQLGGESFVQAYDLSVPAVPELLGEFSTSEYGIPIYYEGLAVNDGTMAVRFHIKVPIEPEPISVDSGWTDDFEINAPLIVEPVNHFYELKILDVSDPAAILEIQHMSFSGDQVGSPEIGNGIIVAPVSGSLKYIANVDGVWMQTNGLPTDALNVVTSFSNGRLFGGDGTRFVEYAAYTTSGNVAGRVGLSYGDASCLEVTDTHAFVGRYFRADGSMGSYDTGDIAVFDLSDPAAPVATHTVHANMGYPLGRFVVHGEYLYADGGSFHWPTGDLAMAHVSMSDAVVNDDVLYAVWNGGIRVYDLSTPSTPVAVGDFPVTNGFNWPVIDTNYLYGFGADISLFDVTSPLAPIFVSSTPVPQWPTGAAIADGLLYLTSSTGLAIYELAAPNPPMFRGQLALEGCTDVTVLGTTAYVSAAENGIVVVDVSEPSAPVARGSYHAGSTARSVSIHDGYVYFLSTHELTILLPECPAASPVDDGRLPAYGDSALRLIGPYPNPFNPRTELQFELDHASHVEFAIHDTAGRRLRTLINETRDAGDHRVQWDGRDEAGRMVSAGVYFAKLRTEEGTAVRKLVLIK